MPKRKKEIPQKYSTKSDKVQAFEDLRKLLGKNIPKKEKLDWNTFGIQYEGIDLVGLNLYNQGLTNLPESIGNFTSLKYLSLNHIF